MLVYLVLDLPQREDGGNALLDNPEKGALMMNTTLVYKYLHWEFMFRLNQSRVLVYLVLDLPQHEDNGNALLGNPEKGALMMNTTFFYKYLHWEFMFRLNQSRVHSYLLLDLPQNEDGGNALLDTLGKEP